MWKNRIKVHFEITDDFVEIGAQEEEDPEKKILEEQARREALLNSGRCVVDLIIVGADGSGKTSLISSFLYGSHEHEIITAKDSTPIIKNEGKGIEKNDQNQTKKTSQNTETPRQKIRKTQHFESAALFWSKTVVVQEISYVFRIWDTSSDPKYKFLLPFFYRLCSVAIVIFPVPSETRDNWEYAQEYVRELRGYDNISVIALIGTKADSHQNSALVSTEEINTFTRFHDIVYLTTSAHDDWNVEYSFHTIAKLFHCLELLHFQRYLYEQRRERLKSSLLNPGSNSSQNNSNNNQNNSINQTKQKKKNSIGQSGTPSVNPRFSLHPSWGSVQSDDEIAPQKQSVHSRSSLFSASETEFNSSLMPPAQISVLSVFESLRSNGAKGFFESDRDAIKIPNWVPDSEANFCSLCSSGFSVFKRKHHCRHCGQIFCSECTKNRFEIPSLGFVVPVRVCDACFKVLSEKKSDH